MPDGDDHRADEPVQRPGLVQHQPAEQGADDDAALAGRGHQGDGGQLHGPQHQDVGDRRQHRHHQGGPGQRGPGPAHLGDPAPRHQAQRRHLTEQAEREVRQRRHVEVGDRVAVPQRVRRDGDAGQHSPDDPRPRVAVARARRPGDEQHPGATTSSTPDPGHDPGPLVEDGDREHERQQRPGAAGQRVDDVELALGVPALERQLVADVHRGAERRRPEPDPLRPVAGDGHPDHGDRHPQRRRSARRTAR